ncbi:MAG: hypothetical protein ACHQDY_09700 [Solirubrobacterales bacterium]
MRSATLTVTARATFSSSKGRGTGMLGDEDATLAGEVLEPGEAAVLICFENAWAGPFAAAVSRNGGRLLDFQRIPTQEVIAAIQALDAAEPAS